MAFAPLLSIMAPTNGEIAAFYVTMIMNGWSLIFIAFIAYHLLTSFFKCKCRDPWYFNEQHHYNHLVIFKGTWWLRSGVYWTITRISYLGLIIMIIQENAATNLFSNPIDGKKSLNEYIPIYNSTFIHEASHYTFWSLFWSFLICRILRYLLFLFM